MDIAVATFTNTINVEHLTSFSVHAHPTNTMARVTGSRALAALRVAAHDLYSRHRDETLVTNRGPRASFPYRDYYIDDADNRHDFEYIEVLSKDKRIFHARTKLGGNPLCVKFSTRYCEDAHRAAFESGFAPRLYAVQDVYDWTMIVMEDKSADYTNLWDKKCTPLEPEDVWAKVRDRLRSLHELGYVHGDVRDVNVLVRNAAVAKTEPEVLLVDWDWAGKKLSATYPLRMNPDIKRPDDARPGEEIKEEHDIWMASNNGPV